MPDEQIPNENPLSDDEEIEIVSDHAQEASEGDIENVVEDALNLSIESETSMVDIITEDELEAEIDGSSIEGDEEITQAEELNLAVESETTSIEKIEDDNIVIVDFLNADDGEPEETPEYLKPATPEWKLHAQKLYEEREAKKRELFERRRKEDERVIAERKALEEKRKTLQAQQEAEFREQWEKRQEEKKSAVDNMMQQIREDRERKLAERAEVEEREFGRRFTYPKPEEKEPYPKPSELSRMEREQPKSDEKVVPVDIEKASESPAKETKSDDLDSRVSRLSKPNSPEPKDDEEQKEG